MDVCRTTHRLKRAENFSRVLIVGLLLLAVPGSFPLLEVPAVADDLPRALVGADGVRLLLVPAGKFKKGSAKSGIQAAAALAKRFHLYARDNWFSDESPPKEVFLPAFYIDETEVTLGRFLYRIRRPPSQVDRSFLEHWSVPFAIPSWQLPVSNVIWKEAEAYCREMGRRLPTSDEWEKAARGADGRLFPWGNAFDARRLNSLEARRSAPVPVGSYPAGASPYGALDMAGNVWEWVADWYDPPQRVRKRRKGVRGGGWGHGGAFARPANVAAMRPGDRHPTVGFRCARDP